MGLKIPNIKISMDVIYEYTDDLILDQYWLGSCNGLLHYKTKPLLANNQHGQMTFILRQFGKIYINL